MDFFEHQDQARRRTRLLVLVFLIAVIGIVAGVDFIVTLVVANSDGLRNGFLVPDAAWASENAGLLTLTSLGTTGFIGAASLYRMSSLNAGGASIAQQLGGVRVNADTEDPLRRRLLNVVEEMSIASGVPVPEVYVLEHEPGLNAFAAGFSTGDAVIAVTRGSLETFTREELQGVIGHEFSHIMNGDMRLNMRLIGILFGILVISLIGRTILRGTRFARGSRGRSSAGGVALILVLGATVTLIGYIGLFIGRIIKAAVSRQREYLADASAVQFTRQPQGLASALKKIAYGPGSVIRYADGEEVSHMLFANGLSGFASLYATHPPVDKRIRALDPNFNPQAWHKAQDAAARAHKHAQEEAREKQKAPDARDRLNQVLRSVLILTPEMVAGSVGNPNPAHVEHAEQLRAVIPDTLHEAARSERYAPLLCLALLMDDSDEIRGRQIEILKTSLPKDSIAVIENLCRGITELEFGFRLPLLEIALPALRRRPPQELDEWLQRIDKLIEADGHVDTFEYLLSRNLTLYIQDAQAPQFAPVIGRNRLVHNLNAVQTLFSVLASIGHENETSARDGYQVGLLSLLANNVDWPEYEPPGRWAERMDQALLQLDRLTAVDKQALVTAMTQTITHDGKVTVRETEVLRAACALLHCPLPPLVATR